MSLALGSWVESARFEEMLYQCNALKFEFLKIVYTHEEVRSQFPEDYRCWQYSSTTSIEIMKQKTFQPDHYCLVFSRTRG